jgi:putative transposase
MARLPRLTLPGYPHHVIQRGNNRQPIFACKADYLMLLQLLGENAVKFGVALHAYVLMSNHFHLLATTDTAEGLPWFSPQFMRRHFVPAHEVGSCG